MSEEQKNLKAKILPVLLSILSSIIILLGATIIYLYSSGYRIDILKREISITGVITVQSEPGLADMYINGDSIGKTPRSHVLKVGNYDISLKKESYRDWNKNISIIEGKSTPLFPFLVYDTIISKQKWISDGLVEKLWINETRNNILFLQKDSNSSYSLWEYTINTPIWDFSSNPVKILNLETNKITLNISPNGQKAVLIDTTSDTKSFYLLNTQQFNNLGGSNQLPLGNYSKYKISWSKNNQYLMLDSSKELLSYNIEKLTFTNLIKKDISTKYTWDTDTEGSLYIITQIINDELEDVYTYSLVQKSLAGNNTKSIIDKIYFQKSEEYIKEYREAISDWQEFANSPESTQSSGEIKALDVNVSAKGMYISTSLASYWYFIDTSKFLMISPYPTGLISYSPDSTKLAFKDLQGYKVFTFDKEEEDHTVKIGSKVIDNVKDNFFWLSDSTYIYFKEDDNIYISDKDGDNKYPLVKSVDILEYSVNSARDILYTFEKDSNGKLTIVENKFH